MGLEMARWLLEQHGRELCLGGGIEPKDRVTGVLSFPERTGWGPVRVWLGVGMVWVWVQAEEQFCRQGYSSTLVPGKTDIHWHKRNLYCYAQDYRVIIQAG